VAVPFWGIQIQIQIPPISKSDAEQYLLGLTLSSNLDQVKAVGVLAKEVGYQPFALSQTGGYMRTSGFTPRKVLEEPKKIESTGQMDVTKASTSLFNLTFENIKRDDSRLLDFLLQLSFIAVPVESMFQDYFWVARSRVEPIPSFYQLFVRNEQWSPERFLHAVQRLATYSLLREELVGEWSYDSVHA
jgi:hypothetical protein